MTVKYLIEELSKINPNYDITVKVGDNKEQDRIIGISKIFCVNCNANPAIGFVQLKTANDLDWKR